MKSEFLLREELSNTDRDEIENLEFELTSKKLDKGSTPFYFIRINAPRESIETAKTLEQLRYDLSLDEKGECVNDGPSLFFSGKLYPLLYRYENSLREAVVLGLRLAKFDDPKANKIIKNLEQYSLDDLIGKLLKSSSVHDAVKKIVSDDSYYEKQDLLNKVGEIDESLLWDTVFEEDAMPTVRSQHREIRMYRNIVAHVRKITFHGYEKASFLLRRANNEITKYIRSLTGSEVTGVGYKSLFDALASSTFADSLAMTVNPTAQIIANGIATSGALGRLADEMTISITRSFSEALADSSWVRGLSDTCKALANDNPKKENAVG